MGLTQSNIDRPALTIGVAATFTAEPLLPALRFWFDALGVAAEFDVAPYGQVVQTLLTSWSAPGATKRANVVFVRVRDWLRELDEERLRSTDQLREYLRETADDLVRAVRTHRGTATSETTLVICPSAAADEHEASIRQIEQQIEEQLRGIPGLVVLVAARHDAAYAVDANAIGDSLREHIGHIPYTARYYNVLATIAARQVFGRLLAPRKAIVVDCDNTLWDGVVGEVGPEGLRLASRHLALQDALIAATSRGQLVCVCSKNEDADVWRAFDTRDDFHLKREHIVAGAINWQPKSENLRALAARLNLGIDSFIFIDDNPVECAEVRSACPDVLTIEWPHDDTAALTLLSHIWEFDGGPATAEDRRRTQLYKEEFERQTAAETLSFADFIASLNLSVEMAPLTEADIPRAAQLTTRTNQFNFTTIRRTEAEMRALAASPAHAIRTVRVRDRFGDYGLVGVLIVADGLDDEPRTTDDGSPRLTPSW
jgi:FkbH-like protein